MQSNSSRRTVPTLSKKAVDLIGNGIYSVYEASIKFNKVGDR